MPKGNHYLWFFVLKNFSVRVGGQTRLHLTLIVLR